MEFDESPTKQEKLTVDNLERLSKAESKPEVAKDRVSKKSTKSSKKAKPAWATTEKQKDDEKEEEIDELIDFAYNLDYEQFLEDYEVR